MSFRFRFTVLFILGRLLVSNFIFMGGRFGSPVLVVKSKPNRTGKISGFSNRFFISVRFSQLIFHRFSRFFWLLGFFEHHYQDPHSLPHVRLEIMTSPPTSPSPMRRVSFSTLQDCAEDGGWGGLVSPSSPCQRRSPKPNTNQSLNL